MIIVGQLLIVLGGLGLLVANILLLTVAYKRSLPWFFGCLFVPIVGLVFLLLHLRACAKPLAIGVGGVLLLWVGTSMAGVVW